MVALHLRGGEHDLGQYQETQRERRKVQGARRLQRTATGMIQKRKEKGILKTAPPAIRTIVAGGGVALCVVSGR